MLNDVMNNVLLSFLFSLLLLVTAWFGASLLGRCISSILFAPLFFKKS